MTSRLLKYVCAVFLSLCPLWAEAQIVELPDLPDDAVDSLAVADTIDYGDSFDDDSVAVADTSKKRQKSYGIDAVKYSLQGRYRPKNDPFINRKFSDNTFYSLHMGTYMMFPVGVREDIISEDINSLDKSKTSIEYSSEFSVGFDMGKRINRTNAVRLSVQGEDFFRNNDNRRYINAGLDVSYLFSMTSYFGGYRLDRFCDLSVVLGMGYRASMLFDAESAEDNDMLEEDDMLGKMRYTLSDFSNMFNLHAGLNVSMKLGHNMDFFFEPLMYVNSFMPYRNTDWVAKEVRNTRSSNFSLGAKMGLTYNVIPEEAARPRNVRGTIRRFVSVAGGLQLHNYNGVFENDVFLRSMGPHGAISYGRVFADDFTVRASIFGSVDVWREAWMLEYFDNVPLLAYYAGFRVEAMYDIFKFFPKTRENFPMAFSLLLGPELGMVFKEDYVPNPSRYYLLKNYYCGVTGGVQLKFRLFRGMCIFLEPRFSAIPYSVPDIHVQGHTNSRYNYVDFVLNANAGLEFYWGRREKKK